MVNGRYIYKNVKKHIPTYKSYFYIKQNYQLTASAVEWHKKLCKGM